MTPFIFSNVDAKHARAWIYDEEAKHCMKVMRKRQGEEVIGIDGKGNMYRARILELGKRSIELSIMEVVPDWGEKPQTIRLLVSPLHKADRFEWLVEKAVELGATAITPYLGKHTVKTGVRLERLQRIALAALKQSLRSRLPQITEPEPFEEVVANCDGAVKLMGHGPSGKPFREQIDFIGNAASIDLLIGPEGDFSESELQFAQDSGFSPIALGSNRLRSETAAIHLLGLVKSAMAY